MSHFDSLPPTKPDIAFSLVESFVTDTFPQKVDLCPGFYRDEEARPWVLPCIKQAREIFNAKPDQDYEHLPLAGHPKLISGAQELIFGSNAGQLSRVASIQTVSGTGSNYLGARILAETTLPKNVWIPDPSWVNHVEVWRNINPDIERRFYPYFEKATHSVRFKDMLDTLRSESVSGDVVILQACAHNPTGLDLSHAQWEAVADVCAEKGLFPLFDIAYQGFASGDLDNDAWPIRHFHNRNTLEFAVAQSFSKNLGLYGERIGLLHVATRSEEAASKVLGNLVRLQRAQITSCPGFGAKLISIVLSDDVLMRQWHADLNHMSWRMKEMRKRLYEELKKREMPGSWEHILSEIGMFSMTSLDVAQIVVLREKHHIYLLPSGRISVTGLTEYNVAYVAEAFAQVARENEEVA